MAWFKCPACGKEGKFNYTNKPGCPSCGSMDAIVLLEPDDDLWKLLMDIDKNSDQEPSDDKKEK